MRKLASIQKIENLIPIKDADRIVVATMENSAWKVIVGKDQFKPGDKVVYFETDSLLPETNPTYADFQKRGQKTFDNDGETIKGHVLKTMKMRGVYSQGLIMPLTAFNIDENIKIGTNVTKKVGIVKYEAPLPINDSIIGTFDTKFAPKTDAERIQNLTEHWEEIKKLNWEPTVKIDGTSQTIINDNGNIRIFGRNWELDKNLSAGYKVAKNFGLIDEISKHPGMAVQFEFAGPGINGNRLKLKEQRPFVFSVWVNHVKLPYSEWPETFVKNSVPPLKNEWKLEGTVDEMIEKITKLRSNVIKDKIDEGVVYHYVGENIPSWMDNTQVIKIINNKYLEKHGL